MLDRSLIGRESEPGGHEVEKGAVRRFAEALGDPNPVSTDEGAARAAGYPSLVAPPTFPIALASNERFRPSLGLGTRNVLHGEQAFEYARPVFAGDRITVRTRVADVQERAGASGPMDVLVLEDEGRDDKGELVFRTRAMLILRRGEGRTRCSRHGSSTSRRSRWATSSRRSSSRPSIACRSRATSARRRTGTRSTSTSRTPRTPGSRAP